jgi:arylsulfatase
MKNILFITCDQLRYDALGFKKYFPVKTPNIDKLVSEGVLFDNAYCANPLCVPARASIMTGKFGHETGVFYNDQAWPENLKTLPGELSKNGYYTVAVGKMHFIPKRCYGGFQKRVGDNDSDYKEYLKYKGLVPGKGDGSRDGSPHDSQNIKERFMHPEPTPLPLEDYETVYTTENALRELALIAKRRECSERGNEPFFMWLSHVKPHSPCDPPEPYFSMYDPKTMPSCLPKKSLEDTPKSLQRYSKHWAALTDEEIQKNRARYMGNVTLIDEQLGRIFSKLKEMGVYDNTLIIFSSDHGDHLGDYGFQQKSFFYDYSAKVPFIFVGPGIPKGKVIRENVSHIDLFPTLLDYCDLYPKEKFDPDGKSYPYDVERGEAVSLLPAINDQNTSLKERVVVSESGVHGLHIMLKKGNLKFNYYANSDEIECYDTEKDPQELNNIGKQFSRNTLPSEIKKKLDEILLSTAKYQTRWYATGGGKKWYRMFT